MTKITKQYFNDGLVSLCGWNRVEMHLLRMKETPAKFFFFFLNCGHNF